MMTRSFRRNSGVRRARGSNQYTEKWTNAPVENANRDRLGGVSASSVSSTPRGRAVRDDIGTGEIVTSAVESAGAALTAQRSNDRFSYVENSYRLAEARSALSERHPNLYGAALASSVSKVATYEGALDKGAQLTKSQKKDYKVARDLVDGSESGMDEDHLTECIDHFVSVQRQQWNEPQSDEMKLRKRLAVLDGSSTSSHESSSEETDRINREIETIRMDQINF